MKTYGQTLHIDNPDPKRWRRRALSIPIALLMPGIMIVTLPLTLPMCLITDLLRKHSSATRALMFFMCYAVFQIIGLSFLSLGWTLYLFHRNRSLFIHHTHLLQQFWSWGLTAGMKKSFSLDMQELGEKPDCGGKILLVRHASAADTVLPIRFISLGQNLRVRYGLKQELRWDPCLDVAGHRLPNAFVHRGAGISEIRRVASLAKSLDKNSCVVLYPEGTRFTPARRKRLIERLKQKKQDFVLKCAKEMKLCLPPKIGGTAGLFDVAPEAEVIIMGHVGFEGAAKFSNLFNGKLKGSRIRIRYWEAGVPPKTNAEREKWLMEHWMTLDKWVVKMSAELEKK